MLNPVNTSAVASESGLVARLDVWHSCKKSIEGSRRGAVSKWLSGLAPPTTKHSIDKTLLKLGHL
jgi:hypothetical protein